MAVGAVHTSEAAASSLIEVTFIVRLFSFTAATEPRSTSCLVEAVNLALKLWRLRGAHVDFDTRAQMEIRACI